MIKLAKHRIKPSDWLRAESVLNSGNLVYGAVGRQVEEELAAYVGAERCLLVSSGTAALHLALMSLGVGPGAAVVCPAFTFPATANVIAAQGARVVFCDVEPNTYNASRRTIEEALAKETHPEQVKAVILVDEFGYPADAAAVRGLCDERGLYLIEDAACAIGCRYLDGKHVGAYAHMTCFSFHPRKTITCGEGGAIAGPHSEWMTNVASLRNHGMEVVSGKVEFVMPGLNYRLTDLQSALLPGQIADLDAEIARRHVLAQRYATRLSSVEDLQLPEVIEGHSLQTYMTVLPPSIDRARLIARMKSLGVEVNYGAPCVPLTQHYRRIGGYNGQSYPSAQSSEAVVWLCRFTEQ